MDYIIMKLSENWIFIIRLLVAMFLGGLIGIERQKRGRAAGLRTNILVCLGSATVIVAFQKLSQEFSFDAESVVRMDPARAAAGVITGIGFLGAGTIMKSRDFVRGLTTAATIWVVSTIGITVGLGEYVIALTLSVLVLFTLYILHNVPVKSDQYYSLHLKWKGNFELADELIEFLLQKKAVVKHKKIKLNPTDESYEANIVYRLRNEEHNSLLLNLLKEDKRLVEVSLD